MSTDKFTEDSYEQTLISLFEKMGYQYECGYEVDRDYSEPYHRVDLQKSLKWLNPLMPDEVLEEAFRKITNIKDGVLAQRNETFTDYLQNGVEVEYYADGVKKTELVKLMDYDCPDNNQWKVVNQWRVEENEPIRCDMVVMVNGLTLVVSEL